MKRVRFTAEQKRTMRTTAAGHFDHCLRLLRERPDGLFLEKARRSLQEGLKAMEDAKPWLPPRSRQSLFNRHWEAAKRLAEVEEEWRGVVRR